MKKFNQWQLHLITEALNLYKEKWKEALLESEKEGKKNLFHPDFVDLTIKETIEISIELTKKK